MPPEWQGSTLRALCACALLAASVVIAACAAPPEPDDGGSAATVCRDPRPEICTREYRPVCATRDTGVRCVTTPCPATETATYGNACEACADQRVLSYSDGPCPQ